MIEIKSRILVAELAFIKKEKIIKYFWQIEVFVKMKFTNKLRSERGTI